MKFVLSVIAAICVVAFASSPTITLNQESNMRQPVLSTALYSLTGKRSFIDKDVLPNLGRATEWLNSPPLSASSLKGKVVVIDFWTYTCINWRRTLPYLRAWAAKYKEQGLVVIGVHSPEFSFEKSVDNVRKAVADMGLEFPIAVDNDFEIWRAFNNQYWPALYVIDSQGHIRHYTFGEGHYEQSEQVIQQLLVESGATAVAHDLVTVNPQGVEVAADWASLGSPETYVGYERGAHFSSPGGVVRGKDHFYNIPEQLRLNQWALLGHWRVRPEAAALTQAGGRIAYRFRARDLHLVMGPAARGGSVRYRVLIDGQPPGDDHGVDVDSQGYGTIADQRLYQLVRQTNPHSERLFEIEFLEPGVEAFSFTFG
jgi:thiol-disulfide isomerase/thioredoxin